MTSAAAVPATVAIPSTAQRCGAGTSTPARAGSQMKVYHSGQAPYGLHNQSPARAAAVAQAHAAGSVQGMCSGSRAPRTSAAAARTRLIAATATAASHDIQSAKPTPAAGGAIPRPR
ncbi:MAG: hypothetical protein DMD46_11000 [Gemmatimonadetes bacterium]|nr:MAG: hypothetical protein DMD46_11000 [Gemmatimonadota bacterium]